MDGLLGDETNCIPRTKTGMEESKIQSTMRCMYQDGMSCRDKHQKGIAARCLRQTRRRGEATCTRSFKRRDDENRRGPRPMMSDWLAQAMKADGE